MDGHDVRERWHELSNRDVGEIERDLDRTRSDLRDTLDALEHKLSRQRLLDLTLGRVREHGGEFASNLGHSMKSNPVPTLLTSIGLAWMMMSERSSANGGHDGDVDTDGHGIGDRLNDARERARQLRGEAREKMEHSRESVAHASEFTRRQLSRGRSTASHLLHEQPLVLGAIGVAVGALLGAALPATTEEDRLLGNARDRTLDKVKAAGSERYEEVRHRIGEVAQQAKAELQEGGQRRQAHERPRQEGEPPF
jgi:ElaB/YqjD/DUF883 family membrane-anchored ribosome-binding protein